MNLNFFDTETTGIPDYKAPSESEHQPHLVQLGAILVESDTRKELQVLDVIIKPDGWSWDDSDTSEDGAFKAHKITMERAMDEGIPEIEALDQFMEIHKKSGLRVAHNTTFDNRIIRIALKRYRPDLIPDEEWKDKSRYHCTMVEYSKRFGGKWPKLVEAYKHLTGKEIEAAHTAIGDTRSCMAIYFALQGSGIS